AGPARRSHGEFIVGDRAVIELEAIRPDERAGVGGLGAVPGRKAVIGPGAVVVSPRNRSSPSCGAVFRTPADAGRDSIVGVPNAACNRCIHSAVGIQLATA